MRTVSSSWKIEARPQRRPSARAVGTAKAVRALSSSVSASAARHAETAVSVRRSRPHKTEHALGDRYASSPAGLPGGNGVGKGRGPARERAAVRQHE